jgi:hypothetical protein
MGRSEDGALSYLALALPVLDVFDVAATAGVDLLARADEHVRGSHNIGNRAFLGIVSGDPDRDWDVVGRLPVGDGEGPMQTEQELGPPVVVSCAEQSELEKTGRTEMDWTVDIRLRTELWKPREQGVGVGVDGVRV